MLPLATTTICTIATLFDHGNVGSESNCFAKNKESMKFNEHKEKLMLFNLTKHLQLRKPKFQQLHVETMTLLRRYHRRKGGTAGLSNQGRSQSTQAKLGMEPLIPNSSKTITGISRFGCLITQFGWAYLKYPEEIRIVFGVYNCTNDSWSYPIVNCSRFGWMDDGCNHRYEYPKGTIASVDTNQYPTSASNHC